MKWLATYPERLRLSASLGERELLLRPFTLDQVEAYGDLLAKQSRVEDSAFRLHSFFAAHAPLPRATAGLYLEAYAERLLRTSPVEAIPFMVWHGGELAGFQYLTFLPEGAIKTDSFLADHVRGLGLGTLMRAAVLTYAFQYLGVREARTSFVLPNHASERVSCKLGYSYKSRTPFQWGESRWSRVDMALEAQSYREPASIKVTLF